MFESSDAESPRERCGRVGSSSKHSPMALVEATSRSTYKKNMDENWNEYSQTRIATYIIVHRGGRGDSGKEKATVSWEEPFH